MWRNQSGAAAAEYALILALLGGALGLGSIVLGHSVSAQMGITAYGPDGTAYVCTANCQFDFKDYCSAIAHQGEPVGIRPTFSPALPNGAKCNGETPIS